MLSTLLALCLLAIPLTFGQLSGPVGPTTSHAAKRNKICSVLDYGGQIGSNDIGPAISSAFTNCVLQNTGSTLYIPPGNYNMATWVTLNGGQGWALQLDGVITRTSTSSGNMIAVTNAKDVEIYSSTSAGTIQGNGYQCRNAGPRLLRVTSSQNFSVHDLILVDSPEFHLVLDTASNAEVYNMAIRGADIGGSDGIDIWGTNVWVHDVMVTNRDECVTVKSPAHNHLIEQIFCNQSGGSAIGSLGTGTDISSILYRNIYTVGGNQMMMIKSNGGSGSVSSVQFQNFIGLGSAYGLDIDQYWSSESPASGNGVQLSNITFSNWSGYISDGSRRSAIRIICADGAPCTQIDLNNVVLWASNNAGSYACESAYGSGACLKPGSGGSYAQVQQSYSEPPGYQTPTTMAGSLASGFPSNSPIPAPTIPTTFFPGLAQISPLAKNSNGGGNGGSGPSQPTSTPSTPTTPTSPPGATQTIYGQCGGQGWSGVTACASGSTCQSSNPYYSQCLP